MCESWSFYGCTATSVPAEKPTMKLSFTGRAPEKYKFLILHEFGHALGLIHEHQREDAPILYNDQNLREFVKNRLKYQNSSHTPTDIENQIKYQWGKLTGGFPGYGKPLSSRYDKDSVMHYV